MAGLGTIHILRHAHSSWALAGQRDHQRPLDERGRADAARLASLVSERAGRIATVVCSTAVRARETLDAIRHVLPAATEIQFDDDLYALGVSAYEAAVRNNVERGELLLVGHNPTIEQFVTGLCQDGEPDALLCVRKGVGTAVWVTVEHLEEDAAGGMRGFLAAVVRP